MLSKIKIYTLYAPTSSESLNTRTHVDVVQVQVQIKSISKLATAGGKLFGIVVVAVGVVVVGVAVAVVSLGLLTQFEAGFVVCLFACLFTHMCVFSMLLSFQARQLNKPQPRQ